MKKLIYILNSYSSKSDQHYFHVINLLEEIARNDVHIALVIEKCQDLPIVDNENISIHAINADISKYKRPVELIKILNRLYNLGYRKVFTRISKSGILISIVFSFFRSKVETYYWHSGTVFDFNRRVKSTIALLKDDIEFWFIKSFVTVFVTGPESMKQYYNKVVGVKESKILILYNDINLSRFDSDQREERKEKNQKLKLDLEDKIILFVHRLSPVRETLYYLPFVLEKFYEVGEFDNYVSVIIGGGSDKEELEKLIENSPYKERIRVLGPKPNAIIQDYYSVANIFINPTMAEGFPRVVIEAEAMGLPIVSTDAGGIRDIVPNEQQRYVVDKKDREGFADALIDLAKKTEVQQELRIINRKYVSKFSTENVAKMYVRELFK